MSDERPPQRLVTVRARCSACHSPYEIDCAIQVNFGGATGFYNVQCPHCTAPQLPHLPGPVAEVRGKSDDE